MSRIRKDFTSGKFTRELTPKIKARTYTMGRLLVDTYESVQVGGTDFSLSALG